MSRSRLYDRSRVDQTYKRNIVPIDPGQNIASVIANAYPKYRSFRLKNGRHPVYSELDINLDGVVLYGDWSTELVLVTEAATVLLSGEGVGIVGCAVNHENIKYSTDTVQVSGSYCRVQDVLFDNANDGVTPAWPLHVLAGSSYGQYIGNVFKPPSLPAPAIVHAYVDNTAMYNLFTGNHCGYHVAGVASNQIAVRDVDLNEAGQVSLVAGVRRSLSNYADILVRV